MKYFYLFLSSILVFAIIFDASSQDKKVKRAPEKVPQDKSIFQKEKVKAGFGVSVVQTQPEFPGGSDSLMSYLKNNLKYPHQAQVNREEGMVFVGFMVDTLGRIQEAKIVGSVSDLLDAEALRVVKEMPAWKPGMIGSTTANSQFILPVEFVLPKKPE